MPAIIFDCDGVLADTEPYGHLVAFNRMWQKTGVPWQWTPEQYAEKLKIGGGKERLMSLLDEPDFQRIYHAPADPAGRKELIARWHQEKTALYQEVINSGAIPARDGIRRICEEALAQGWKLAVASTSALPSVEVVLRHVVGPEIFGKFAAILAGDIVPRKKPAPDIYQLALSRLSLDAREIVVVEDSRNGLLAAKGAGLKTVVTVSYYTVEEDFREAELVVSSLGDPGLPPITVRSDPLGLAISDYVRLQDLAQIIG